MLVNLHSFDPQEVVRAYEEDGVLYFELGNGDDMIADYVHLCEDEQAAWKLYSDYVEEKTGKKLPGGV